MTASEHQIIALLWDSLKRDPKHPDRRQTGNGTKTKRGLIASLNAIYGRELPEQADAGSSEPAGFEIETDEEPDEHGHTFTRV